MEFICSAHWQRVTSRSLTQKQNLWRTWMESALQRCEQRDWRCGAAFSEHAFELAWLTQQSHADACMPVELTLAAIFTVRNLLEQGAETEARQVITRALARLSSELPSLEQSVPRLQDREVLQCLQVLQEPARQENFFTDYLNWPDIWAGQSRQLSVYH